MLWVPLMGGSDQEGTLGGSCGANNVIFFYLDAGNSCVRL